MPKNICAKETITLREFGYYTLPYRFLAKHQMYLEANNWQFFVVDQTRGRCYWSKKEITIPKWVLFRAPDRIMQYILHEIAHALVMERYGLSEALKLESHGKEFMDILIEICPKEFLIHEMTYKPSNLVKAGAVFCPDSLNF